MVIRRSLLPLVVAALALAACGRAPPAPEQKPELDPAIVAALADPIMIDPDLASQNGGNAAITLDTFDAVPLDDLSPEALDAAKAEAARLAGGMIRTAPEPSEDGAAEVPAITAGQLAAALPSLPAGCAAGLRYGYGWATTMPAALPIYPRGHVEEAAGSNACGLRSVVFSTPVDPATVIDFYFTRAGDGGYSAQRSRRGEADVLSGTKGSAVFLVRVRRAANGLSEVELATRG